MFRVSFVQLVIAVCLLLSLGPLAAQTTMGSIVGTVTDNTGAAVPGAAVAITNVDTNITTKTTTDSSGTYVVTPLPVGHYSVAVEANGFKRSLSEGITLNVQDRIGVNVALELGQISETVEVSAAAPALQTDTSYLGQVMDSQKIVDLPLNGRYFTRLAVLTAGAVPTAPGARDEATGGFSANGVRPYQNNYLLDGIDNNSLSEDLTNAASFVVGPSPDAIQEFRVQTNSMSAEFGRSGGAVLNVTIKNGTNNFHGSAFEFLRNSQLDAKNFFDPPTGPTPPFKQNQFGASAGGPILLPHYNGKNRTFFFVDYQGTRVRTAETFLATVPTAAWHSGNFAGFNTIFDPNTTVTQPNGTVVRQAFPNNQIPLSRFDPASAKLAALMPLPNVPGSVGTTGVANNYLTNPVSPDQSDQGDVRIDHKISDKDSLFARFSMSDQVLSPPAPLPPPIDAASFSSGNWTNNTRQGVFSETHIFSPHIINEFRVGYTRLRTERLQFDADQNISAQVGIPGIPYTTGNGGLPRFDVSGAGGIHSFGSATYQPTREFENVFHFIENVSLIHGRHTFKFGAEWKPQVNFSILQPPTPRGRFQFNGNSTRDPNNRSNTGLGFADFDLGALSNASVSSFINDTFQQPGAFVYVQDDFRVSSKLTFNIGLRYEFISMPIERRNGEANYNLDTGALDIPIGRNDPLPPSFFPEIPINRNAPRQLVPQDENNFAPRLGFAYQLNKKTVIRSGYGIFYSSYEAGPLSIPNMGNNPPFYANSNYAAVSFAVLNPTVNHLSQGLPLNALANPAAPSLFSLDPNFRDPYFQHWNFGIQRELGFNSVWDISYGGSKGTKLYEFRNPNQPLPSADPNAPVDPRRPRPFLGADLTYWCSCGSSTYHSLQTKIEKRFTNNLSFLAAYTFGKSIDEQSQASLGFNNSVGVRSEYNYRIEKGLSDFNQTHRFVVSYTYNIPFGHNLTGPAKIIVDGWQLMGIHSFTTGTPNTIGASTDFSNTGGSARPNAVLGVSQTPPGGQGPQEWFNPAAFTNPASGQFGNVGRNTLTGPGNVSIDFSLFKNFPVTEHAKLQFRVEAFNIINHPNFGTMNTTYDSSNPGQLTTSAAARQIQLALKLLF